MNEDLMFQNLCMYYPSVGKEASRYWVDSLIPYELILECHDRSVRIYNNYTNSIRRVIDDINAITEEERRREFGRRLRHAMSRKGYTQDTFAETLGISRVVLNGYIAGRHVASYTMTWAMADILGCSMDDLRIRY